MTGDTRAKPRSKLSELLPRRFFLETWNDIDREAREERSGRESYDYRPLVALVVGAVCLTAMEYLGSSSDMTRIVRAIADGERTWLSHQAIALQQSDFYRLSQYGWWSGWRVIGYFLIPALTIKLVFRGRLRDYGLSTRGLSEHLWIYGVCFFAVLLLVVFVSFRGDFSSYYPFYKMARRSWFDLLVWELFYAAQFFSLEFFFRGFWLKSCKSSMGSYAIAAMVVPYCMIHFGKPWMEVLAAVVAGIVLGTLAMKTRSIWNGFFIHVSVALSMDLAALLQTGPLPSTWFPG